LDRLGQKSPRPPLKKGGQKSPAVNSCNDISERFFPITAWLRKHLLGIFLHRLSIHSDSGNGPVLRSGFRRQDKKRRFRPSPRISAFHFPICMSHCLSPPSVLRLLFPPMLGPEKLLQHDYGLPESVQVHDLQGRVTVSTGGAQRRALDFHP
jgi:hypothetical protein